MENKLFRMPPRSSDARTVWQECSLNVIDTYANIRDKLWNWIHAAEGRLVRQDRHYIVKWTTKSGARLEAKWETFLNWVLCACEEYVPPKLSPEILNPFAVSDVGDSIIFSSNFLDSYLASDEDPQPITTVGMTKSVILSNFSESPGFLENMQPVADETRHSDQRRNAFSEPDEAPCPSPLQIVLSKTPQPESPTG
jgi:hypothetical protein